MCGRGCHWNPAFCRPSSTCGRLPVQTLFTAPPIAYRPGLYRVSALHSGHVRIWPSQKDRHIMGADDKETRKTRVTPFRVPLAANGGYAPGLVTEPGRVLAADRWLARKFLAALGNPRLAIVFWNGEEVCTCADRPVARAVVRDRGALYRMLTNPVLHFGDLYSAKRIDIEGDLVQFLEAT